MSHKVKRTGKTRFRIETRVFKKPVIVLQVEERNVGRLVDIYGSSPDFDYTYWRDATVEDITSEVQTK